jgi:alpha-glutamyl/putrescinyl thymine pyrophosphorylase-like protein
VPRFCRHNRFLENCPICSQEEAAVAGPPAAPRRAAASTATRRSGSAARSRSDSGMRVRRTARPVADGYANGLVPGLRATPDARRLADEIAFAAGRLVQLETDPPGLYAEVAALPDAEEALWLAFLLGYLTPTEGDAPFAAIEAVRTPWAGGADPNLDGAPTGPRTAHEPGRGTATLDAYRAWAARSGSQLAGLTGEPSWSPERRFDRAYERLSFPGLHRAGRMDFLAIVGRVGIVDLLPGSLHFQGSAPTTVAAKRVFGIGDAMLLERRARALADAVGTPLEALDLALYNFGAGDDRATLGAPEEVAARVERGPIDAALGLD